MCSTFPAPPLSSPRFCRVIRVDLGDPEVPDSRPVHSSCLILPKGRRWGVNGSYVGQFCWNLAGCTRIRFNYHHLLWRLISEQSSRVTRNYTPAYQLVRKYAQADDYVYTKSGNVYNLILVIGWQRWSDHLVVLESIATWSYYLP